MSAINLVTSLRLLGIGQDSAAYYAKRKQICPTVRGLALLSSFSSVFFG